MDLAALSTPQLAVALDRALRAPRVPSTYDRDAERERVAVRRALEWELDSRDVCNRCYGPLDPAGGCPAAGCGGPLRLAPNPAAGGPSYVRVARDARPADHRIRR